MKAYNRQTGTMQRQLADLERPYRERLRDEKLDRMSEDVQEAHRTPREKRTPEQESSVLETGPQLQVTEAELAKALTADDRKRRMQIQAELKKVPQPPSLPLTLALQNTNGPAPATHILLRGDYNNPAQVVTPTYPVSLRPSLGSSDSSQVHAVRPHSNPAGREGEGRSALARWLTAPENPLTARVLVNRVWQHHFGRGLVATPNDFGTQGAPPTHPELLDWLAHEFQKQGQSLKALHRLILLSATYQQSSDAPPATRRLDPENRWFSRQNRVRLEGEALRDSLLQISGQLNPVVGGPSVQPPIAADIVKTARNWNASTDAADHRRRSLYILARRNLRFPFLEVFDAPDSNLSCPERGQSTTAPQSLTLLNSQEVTVASRETARRLFTESNQPTPAARIEAAFRSILGRRPDRVEARAAREFVESTRARRERSLNPGENPAGSDETYRKKDPPVEWTELCRALFNLNDFVYVD
jgi:hypothetical protein